MASMLTGTPIAYSGQEAMDYIIRPALATGKIEEFFKVVPNVKEKQQVIFTNPVYKITHVDPGCGSGPNNPTIMRTQKYWNPDPVEAWLDQCYTDLSGTLHEKQLKGGNDRPDLTGTKIEEYMLDLATPAAYSDMMRFVWLGKKAIVSAELTTAGDVSNYNQTDGIWTKIFTAVAASLIPRTTITQNTGAAGSQGLTPQQCKDYLQAVYLAQLPVFKQVDKTKKVFYVTNSVYEGYETFLESQNALETAYTKLQDGQEVLKYRGIPLIVVDIVDQFLVDFAPSANSGAITLPNRIILTVKDNFQIGVNTDSASPEAFDVWFERMTKKWNARLNYRICTQIALEEYVSVGY